VGHRGQGGGVARVEAVEVRGEERLDGVGYRVHTRSIGESRLSKRLAPTEAGRRLIAAARVALDELRAAAEDLTRLDSETPPVVRFTSQCSTHLEWLPEVLRTFLAACPEAEVRVESVPDDRPVPALLDERVDVALVTKPDPAQERVDSRLLFEDELVAVFGADHALAGRAWLEARHFDDVHLIVYDGYDPARVPDVRLPLPAGARPLRVSTMPLVTELLVQLVAASDRVTVLPRRSRTVGRRGQVAGHTAGSGLGRGAADLDPAARIRQILTPGRAGSRSTIAMKTTTHRTYRTYRAMARLLAVSVVCAIGAGDRAAGQTTTLTFANSPTWQNFQAGYGDRVTGPNQGGFPFGGAGSYTPGVIATFASLEGGNTFPVHHWHSGYNGLLDVIWCAIAGMPSGGGELVVTLTGDPGRRVSLHSFDIGNWGAAITLPYVRVVNEDGLAVFEQFAIALQPNTSAPFNVVLNPAPVGRVLSLHIGLAGLFGLSANVGLDNVRFSELGGPTGEVGTRFCGPAVANSSAGPASLRVWGQSSVAANDVRLVATGLPLGSFGFFLASRTQGNVVQPGGSQGVLCLGGAIGRYVGAGQVVNSGFTGNCALDIDLTQMPTPTGHVAAQAGQTWNFTAWFRDANPASTSNFTDAVAVLLQ